MQDADGDISDSMNYLRSIIHERNPDLLHLSQYCYGCAGGCAAEGGGGAQRCDELESGGPRSAARRFLGAVVPRQRWSKVWPEPACWLRPRAGCWTALKAVTAGSRTRASFTTDDRPALFNPFVSKHNYAASVGRLWDEGKQSHLLHATQHSATPHLSCRCRGPRWRSSRARISARQAEAAGRCSARESFPKVKSGSC